MTDAGPRVVPLPPGRGAAAARVLADAFVDDPGWVDVGPDARGRRWRFVQREQRGVIATAERFGGAVSCTLAGGERPAAVAVVFGPGGWPPPWRALVLQAAAPVLAGPPAIVRALKAERVLAGGHPPGRHVFLSMLAVDPASQRRGHGRALLSHVIEQAEREGLPCHLDTANPANVAYYRGFGFEVTGEGRLPRGAPAWFMVRPPRSEGRGPPGEVQGPDAG